MIDSNLLRREFPLNDDLIYLNHAGVSPWPARTADAVRSFAEENIHRGASRYSQWLGTESRLREQCRRLINAPSTDEISLLKNTSEGVSVVACGLDWKRGDNVVSSDEEFPSNRIPWQAQQGHGVEFRQINLQGKDPEADLIAACDARTRVLAISSVQFASGRRLNLPRLGKFCKQRGMLFFVDGIQSLGAMKVDVQEAGIDFFVADGHKWMLGPEGVALFYCRADLREQIRLHQYGWHMTDNAGDYDAREWQPADSGKRFECGSANMLGIHALSASLSLLEEIGVTEIERIILKNTSYLIDKLNNIKGVSVLTPTHPSEHAGIVSFRLVSRDQREVHQLLLDKGIICACRGGAIRFSPHFYTSREQLDRAAATVASLLTSP